MLLGEIPPQETASLTKGRPRETIPQNDVGQSWSCRRVLWIPLAAEAVVDDPNGGGSAVVRFAFDLRLCFRSRTVYLYTLLAYGRIPPRIDARRRILSSLGYCPL